MTIFVVPDGRDAWDFHGAADVDGGRYVRGRVSRQSAVVIEDLPGGGLRYRALGAEFCPISGGGDASDGRGGTVLGEEMAPHAPPDARSAPAEPERSSTTRGGPGRPAEAGARLGEGPEAGREQGVGAAVEGEARP